MTILPPTKLIHPDNKNTLHIGNDFSGSLTLVNTDAGLSFDDLINQSIQDTGLDGFVKSPPSLWLRFFLNIFSFGFLAVIGILGFNSFGYIFGFEPLFDVNSFVQNSINIPWGVN